MTLIGFYTTQLAETLFKQLQVKNSSKQLNILELLGVDLATDIPPWGRDAYLAVSNAAERLNLVMKDEMALSDSKMSDNQSIPRVFYLDSSREATDKTKELVLIMKDDKEVSIVSTLTDPSSYEVYCLANTRENENEVNSFSVIVNDRQISWFFNRSS